MEKSLLVTRGDTLLVWLKILTLFLGFGGTIAVVFLADVMTTRLANPVGVAGVEAVTMSEVEELHHWIGYKVALKAMDDRDVVYHVGKLFASAADPKQKSALDGILAEHMPAGHFIHTKNILKELLGTKAEPQAFPTQLEAKLALALVKENKADDAKAQLEHTVTVTSGHAREEAQQALEAVLKGDMEAAVRLLTHLSGAEGHEGTK